MSRRILVVQGHPDPRGGRLGHALAEAYAAGAQEVGHEVRRIDVAQLDFPLLRTWEDFYGGGVAPETIRACQATVAWAEHLAIFHPLWLGEMPALLKGFFEQLLRPGFAFGAAGSADAHKPLLGGRSAHVVVTMGMPAFVYRWYFRAHSLRVLERNILGFVGFAPVRHTLIGAVEQLGEAGARRWIERMRALGRQG